MRYLAYPGSTLYNRTQLATFFFHYISMPSASRICSKIGSIPHLQNDGVHEKELQVRVAIRLISDGRCIRDWIIDLLWPEMLLSDTRAALPERLWAIELRKEFSRCGIRHCSRGAFCKFEGRVRSQVEDKFLAKLAIVVVFFN